MLYWFFKSLALGPVLKLLFRPWVEGEEHVPTRGGAIIASNHLSFSDSFFLPLVLSRRITFPAKMEYFTGRGLKGRLTAAFFRGVGQIPIDRSGGKASQAALRSGLEVLRRGELFGIYPEGTRSPDGRLYRGKTGVARLALEAGVPIIPVAMIGTDKAQPTGQIIPKVMRIGIRFGEPVDVSRYAGMQEDRHVLRAVTDEVMYSLMELSGQEYVDEYAATRKQRMLEAAKARAEDARTKARELQDQTRVRTDEALLRAKELQEQTKVRAKELGDPARLRELGDEAFLRAKELGDPARLKELGDHTRAKAEGALARATSREGSPAAGEDVREGRHRSDEG
ncbi:lysophospholipid acyltransferase family protein [Arsenicicoccus dermatophilus]|uniref:lysophospholipid acyltransferase family protein n=1 Tax=Arsenicicoccus dermatophilus TaxID=1076331 RepID=UPI001F4C6C37|nr:lysophospholipid acyltransferase family protein [Arsenicicoccus dermatophilus]MCH8612655.1 1-acyl-sn-glycerol-3-phosphate acyltransferase [Arsenicicoccus dermatophilus]